MHWSVKNLLVPLDCLFLQGFQLSPVQTQRRQCVYFKNIVRIDALNMNAKNCHVQWVQECLFSQRHQLLPGKNKQKGYFNVHCIQTYNNFSSKFQIMDILFSVSFWQVCHQPSRHKCRYYLFLYYFLYHFLEKNSKQLSKDK